MNDETKPSWRKNLLFLSILCVMFTAATALSTYKIAVANSYVTQEIPIITELLPKPSQPDLERGAHIAHAVGCADCHGDDFGGRMLLDGAGYATVSAPNITAGAGGRLADLGQDELLLVLRTGLDGENRVLWGMPRSSLNALAQDDVYALAAYLRSRPAVNRSQPQNRLNWRGYVDVALRKLRLLDRTKLPIQAPKIAPSAVGLDNAAYAFGSRPHKKAAWRQHAPKTTDADFADYTRQITHCESCHGASAPIVGRVSAKPLRADHQDISRCAVRARLAHLTSIEWAAIFSK